MKNPNPYRTKINIANDLVTCKLRRPVDIPDDGFYFSQSVIDSILKEVLQNNNTNGLTIGYKASHFWISGICTLNDITSMAATIDTLDDAVYAAIMSHKLDIIQKFIHSAFKLDAYVSYSDIDGGYTSLITVDYDIPFINIAGLGGVLVNDALNFAGNLHLFTDHDSMTIAYPITFTDFSSMEKSIAETLVNIEHDNNLLKTLLERTIRFNFNLD